MRGLLAVLDQSQRTSRASSGSVKWWGKYVYDKTYTTNWVIRYFHEQGSYPEPVIKRGRILCWP